MSVPLHTRFEEIADRHRDRIAVVCEGQTLTFAELNVRANRVAHRLRELGARPDDLVGLCTERGLNMIVGMLAILKSGPPTYLWIRLIRRNASLSCSRMRRCGSWSLRRASRVISPGTGVNCLPLLDTPIEASEHNPEPAAGPNNLAYAIYTSGSTGKPKGVLISTPTSLGYSKAQMPGSGSDPKMCGRCFTPMLLISRCGRYGVRCFTAVGSLSCLTWVSRDPIGVPQAVARAARYVLNQTPSAFRQLLQADLAETRG